MIKYFVILSERDYGESVLPELRDSIEAAIEYAIASGTSGFSYLEVFEIGEAIESIAIRVYDSGEWVTTKEYDRRSEIRRAEYAVIKAQQEKEDEEDFQRTGIRRVRGGSTRLEKHLG
jgi:hypothetical protein